MQNVIAEFFLKIKKTVKNKIKIPANDSKDVNSKRELDKILYDSECRSQMIENFAILKQQLGGKGASKRTAELVLTYLK